MKFLQKPAPLPDRNGAPRMVDAGTWAKGLPALSEFLSEARWDDGSPRVTGSITLFCDDGVWKLCLSDKDAGRVAFVSAGTPTEVFAAADKALQSSSLDWRVQKAFGGKKRKD